MILPLEVGNLDGLVFLIVLVMFGPALLLLGIGLLVRRSNKKAAKVFYILAGIYLLVSLGICGTMLTGY
ncbi:MAG: hypothetical protein Mars2KO_12090 [Maribacter sp.]|uniref:hypothetical protein n=1 Tax=Maribacter sp. 2307UL18-2 TaxID=3386274 RepID=UPI0039BC3142